MFDRCRQDMTCFYTFILLLVDVAVKGVLLWTLQVERLWPGRLQLEHR